MRGFILAAGFGTRLRPVTDHLPKAMVPLAGRPLLHYALDFLGKSGVQPLGVNTHYLPEQLSDFRGRAPQWFELFHETPAIRGTGGALHFARQFLGIDETFVVANVDILARFDLPEQIRRFETSDDWCRLLAWKNDIGTGTIVYDPDTFRYTGAANEVTDRNSPVTADFIGIALYRREFLQLLASDEFSIVPVWQRAIRKGIPVSIGLIEGGYWRDIGNPGALAAAHFDIIDNRLGILPPEGFFIHEHRRCCYPSRWSAELADRLGSYCWIGNDAFEPRGTIERTVVFPEVLHAPRRPLRNVLLTPWGEIPFDE